MGVEYANEKCQNSNHSSGKIQSRPTRTGDRGGAQTNRQKNNKFFFLGSLPLQGLKNVKTFFKEN
jgi:hypothetical protein